MSDDIVPLKFVKPWRNRYAGETTGKPEKVADRLVREGYAVAMTDAPSEPPEDKAVRNSSKSDDAARERLEAMADGSTERRDSSDDERDQSRHLSDLGYHELRSLAAGVADEEQDDGPVSRSTDDLLAYLREHGYE
jgi:hypothetical protein